MSQGRSKDEGYDAQVKRAGLWSATVTSKLLAENDDPKFQSATGLRSWFSVIGLIVLVGVAGSLIVTPRVMWWTLAMLLGIAGLITAIPKRLSEDESDLYRRRFPALLHPDLPSYIGFGVTRENIWREIALVCFLIGLAWK